MFLAIILRGCVNHFIGDEDCRIIGVVTQVGPLQNKIIRVTKANLVSGM